MLWRRPGLRDSIEGIRPIVKGTKVVQGHRGLCSGEKLDRDLAQIESAKSLVANCKVQKKPS